MLVPLHWLKEYVDIQQSPEELAEVFNSKILEVESFIQAGKSIKNVIVAQIKEVNKHPQADKLHVLKVYTGREDLQIVCGAANVAEGKKVALALVGAVLPGDFEIKRAKIRGIESFGMCCSEKELGLAADSAGIMILPDDAPIGQDFVKYMGLDNVIYDLAILPNRGDLQSLRALAIEVHAATDAKLSLPVIHKKVKTGQVKKIDITIKNPELCGRYMGCILKVKIKPSPDWLQRHLKAIGLRPINNVVDITNYILHELGQPLHAFDYSKLTGGKIIVRCAKQGEFFITLDEKKCELTDNMLIIADAHQPVALAGIMGGGNSAVDDKTQTILLESAFFNRVTIRKTSKTMGLRTDSSIRFEKGVAFDGVEDGFYRAIQLFRELADGELISEIADLTPGRPEPLKLKFSPEKANKILGTDIPEKEMLKILEKLQFQLQKTSHGLEVTVPSARVLDVFREIDLIEEIARMYGYNNIKAIQPGLVIEKGQENKQLKVENIVHAVLRSAGLTETMSYSMTSPDIYKNLGVDLKFSDEVRITNPLSVEESVLRQSLLPQLIKALQYNLDQKINNVGLYEIGKVYSSKSENLRLAGIIYGDLETGALPKTSKAKADFYYLKGVLENILDLAGIEAKKPLRAASPFLHPGKSLELKPLLILGELSPLIRSKLGLPQPAFVFELDLEQLIKMAGFKKVFKALNLYPASARDIAFLIDKTVAAAEVERVIQAAAPELVESIELFDRYQGENIPPDKVSLAYSIVYRAKDRTLKDEEVNAMHDKIAKTLVEKLKINFR